MDQYLLQEKFRALRASKAFLRVQRLLVGVFIHGKIITFPLTTVSVAPAAATQFPYAAGRS